MHETATLTADDGTHYEVDFCTRFPRPTEGAQREIQPDRYPDPEDPVQQAAFHGDVAGELAARARLLWRTSRMNLDGWAQEKRDELETEAKRLARCIEESLNEYERIFGREARQALTEIMLGECGAEAVIQPDGSAVVRLRQTGDLFD